MRAFGVYAFGILVVAFWCLFYFWEAPMSFLTNIIETNEKLSALAFISMLFLATVFAPLAVMPAVPVIAPIFGPFLTGLYSVIGWSLGAIVAFFISRKLGRPVVAHFTDIEKLDRLAARIPEHAHLYLMVLLRMSIPADVLSYALGLIKGIKFVPYTIATVIGVSFFSFAFAYLGSALFESAWFLLFALGAVSIVLFSLCWFILLKHFRRAREDDADAEGQD